MGPYILIFKARSIELHNFMSVLYPNHSQPSTWPSLKHFFSKNFRAISFSDCSHTRNLISETDTYTTTLFAYDVIQGLFQYVVQLTLSSEPSTLPPSLQVTLIRVYPLISSGRIADMETTMASTNPTRGFISAHDIGPQGKRAVWIERGRSSTAREVQVWSKEPSLTGHLDSPSGTRVTVPTEIERRVVYLVNSYNLRGARYFFFISCSQKKN